MRVRVGGVFALVFATVAWTQSSGTTSLSGVYTTQQAEAGQARYEAICAACHEGDEPEANPPKGSEFIERWRDAPLSFLHDFVRTKMPGDKPGTLSEADYVNLVAYLLQANGYAAGNSDLSAARMKSIQLVGPEGPKPLPANALVSALGCLSGGGDEWTLTSATAPCAFEWEMRRPRKSWVLRVPLRSVWAPIRSATLTTFRSQNSRGVRFKPKAF